ncbi:(+)-pulegone reductase [Linum perenne]
MGSVGENLTVAAGGEGKLVESKEWYLAAYSAQGVPTSDNLKLRHVIIPAEDVPAGHVLAQTLWISVDPYLRSLMAGYVDGLHMPQLKLNEVLKTWGAAKVIRSKHEDYVEGDIIFNHFHPIADYAVIDPTNSIMKKIDASSRISLPERLNCLAWLGIVKLGEAKEGDNVFISAAAGGVGMLGGQLAKLKGCRVVGSTGSDHKVEFIKNEMGYDDAFNYKKETDFDTALSK